MNTITSKRSEQNLAKKEGDEKDSITRIQYTEKHVNKLHILFTVNYKNNANLQLNVSESSIGTATSNAHAYDNTKLQTSVIIEMAHCYNRHG